MDKIVLIKDDDNIFGFATTEDEAVEWVKSKWGYDDEKIEYEKKQGVLSFQVVEKI